MDTWNDSRDGDWDSPPADKQEGPPQQTYFGLTATQFNVAVLGVIGAGALAIGLFFFGGASAMQDLFSGDDKASPESAAVVQTATPTATAVPSTATPPPTPSPTTSPTPATDIDDGTDEGSGDTVESVLSAFDPFTMMGALGSSGSPSDITISGPTGASLTPSEQVDESLKAILVREGDLPPGFQSFGDMAFSVPTGTGTADMVASMFASGDVAGDDFETMVMSAVMVGPDVTAEFGDFDALEEMTQADLDEAAAAMEEFGMTLIELETLDASGLGDGGMGIHMVMDFSGMLEALGMPEDESALAGIAWDMYVFTRGERVLMVMVMWPSDGAAGADARALAEIMDARAAAP